MICECCGTELDMRKYSNGEAISVLVRMGMASTYSRMRRFLLLEGLDARKMLKKLLEDNDHYWLRK